MSQGMEWVQPKTSRDLKNKSQAILDQSETKIQNSNKSKNFRNEAKRAKNEQIPLKVNVAKNQYKTSSLYFGMNTENRSAGFDIACKHTVNSKKYLFPTSLVLLWQNDISTHMSRVSTIDIVKKKKHLKMGCFRTILYIQPLTTYR